jgi:hypothetical protein
MTMDANAGGRDATLPMTGSVRRSGRAEDGRPVGGGRDWLRCITEHRCCSFILVPVCKHLDGLGTTGGYLEVGDGVTQTTNGNVIYHIIKKRKERADRPGGGVASRCGADKLVTLFLSHPSSCQDNSRLLCLANSENKNSRGSRQISSSVGVALDIPALAVPRSRAALIRTA